MVILTQLLTYPSTKRRLGFAKINCHIEYAPSRHANELPLRLPHLIMQAAQHAARGTEGGYLEQIERQFDLVPEYLRVQVSKKSRVRLGIQKVPEQNIWNFVLITFMATVVVVFESSK